MKSFKLFKGYLGEHMSPVANIDTSGTQDIAIPEIRNELNRHIALIFRQEFVTVDSAIQRLSKILALYSLYLPDIDTDDTKSGKFVVPIGNNDTRWDEMTGKLVASNPWNLKFSYAQIDGLYKCQAEVY